MIMSLKWRLLAAKGMNYAEERDEYDKAAERKQSRAVVSEPLRINARQRRFGGEAWNPSIIGMAVSVDPYPSGVTILADGDDGLTP